MGADKEKPRKKLTRRDLSLKSKVLVAGAIAAVAVLFMGMAIAGRLGWNANEARQSCVDQVDALVLDMTKQSPPGVDTTAMAEIARKAEAGTPSCHQAADASATLAATITWCYRLAALVLLASALPWLYHLLRRRSPAV